MGTRKTVDQILDGAADILEKHGWVTENCYDSDLGGFCALGAIAKTVYPKVPNRDIDELSFPVGKDGADPRHVEAVLFLAKRLPTARNYGTPGNAPVYSFNDSLPDGTEVDEVDGELRRVVVDEKVRLKSSRRVVTRLRNAAKAYRKQQENAR